MMDDPKEWNPKLEEVEGILRSLNEDDVTPVAPPAALWSSIEQALASEAGAAEWAATGNLVDLGSWRRRRRPMLAGAAAVVLGLVAVGIAVFADGASDGEFEVVGAAELVWDDGFVDEGVDLVVSTSIVSEGDDLAVRLDEGDLPERADEDLELWLIGVDQQGEMAIQSLGRIDGPAESFAVPDGFDVGGFETVLVDISFEPRDGIETHSGASLVRGPIVNL